MIYMGKKLNTRTVTTCTSNNWINKNGPGCMTHLGSTNQSIVGHGALEPHLHGHSHGRRHVSHLHHGLGKVPRERLTVGAVHLHEIVLQTSAAVESLVWGKKTAPRDKVAVVRASTVLRGWLASKLDPTALPPNNLKTTQCITFCFSLYCGPMID